MPPHNWQVDPLELIRQFEDRHNSPAGGALLLWAVWTVDSLHYLDDLDLAFTGSLLEMAGHDPSMIDVAHARWAAGTSISSLDLCAAGLGRTFCGQTQPRELDLGNFDPRQKNQDRKY